MPTGAAGALDVEGRGLPPVAAGPLLFAECPLCQSPRLHYALSHGALRTVRCADCRLLFLNPQPPEETAAAPADGADGDLARATARMHLEQIGRYRGRDGGRLLELSQGAAFHCGEAERLGYAAIHERVDAPRGGIASAEAAVDVCIARDLIESVRDPIALLADVRRRLGPSGVLFLTTTSPQHAWLPGLRRRREAARLRYFSLDSSTLRQMLYRAGFEHVLVSPRRVLLHLEQVRDRLAADWPLAGGALGAGLSLTPAAMRQRVVRAPGEGLVAFARTAPAASRRTLSVVVPAYNEAATFDSLMQRLLHKRIAGVDIEIIVVESNSNDGTREIAARHGAEPNVTVVFEERPFGKGHAVRAGLERARGEFVLIQDADLEYDVEDYDALLEPLLAGRNVFVLGARHGGHAWWKMRHFSEAPLLSLALNFGHGFFTTLVNVLFGLWLKDPFTMYKVFRRDCLFGLELRCNRFDFDFELLIKLARKGYVPVEIPVNYRSRSFAEGKKVSMFRDPITWLQALARLRVERLHLLENAGRVHAHEASATGE